MIPYHFNIPARLPGLSFFYKVMWQSHRIACITNHKFPKENWPPEKTAQRPNSVSMVVSIGLSQYLFYDAARFDAGQPKIKSLKAIR